MLKGLSLLATLGCVLVAVFLILSDLREEIVEHRRRDSLRKVLPASLRSYSYNICAIPSDLHSRGLEGSKPELPKAYRAFHSNTTWSDREKRCSLSPEEDWGLWRSGPVSSLLPERVPPSELCNKLLLGEEVSREEAGWIKESNRMQPGMDLYDLVVNSMDCNWVRRELSNNFYMTDAEINFPIAYAINIHRDVHQIIRFLRMIYRPQNIYCLHFDWKSSKDFKVVFFNIATCMDNIIIPRRIENVYRGWHTLVDAHQSCFSDLMLAREAYPWRYVITLCGKELPLRTNAEIVSLLEPLNGTSSVQLVGEDGLDEFKYKWKWSLNTLNGWITKRDSRLGPIPHHLKVYKSWAYVALSHQFVQHLLCSPVGREMREYMRDVRIPEENLYAMLFMEPNTPGGYRPEFEDKIFQVISCIWMDGDHHGLLRKYEMFLFPWWFCSGSNIHNICMVSAFDLHRLPYRPGISGYQDIDTYLRTGGTIQRYAGPDRGPLFHNKYVMRRDRVVMDCMEQELGRRNRKEYERECLS